MVSSGGKDSFEKVAILAKVTHCWTPAREGLKCFLLAQKFRHFIPLFCFQISLFGGKKESVAILCCACCCSQTTLTRECVFSRKRTALKVCLHETWILCLANEIRAARPKLKPFV
jgi:hypothetical protein